MFRINFIKVVVISFWIYFADLIYQNRIETNSLPSHTPSRSCSRRTPRRAEVVILTASYFLRQNIPVCLCGFNGAFRIL